MQVILQLRSSPRVRAASALEEGPSAFASSVAASVTGIAIDPAFAPVPIPSPRRTGAAGARFSLSDDVEFSTSAEDSTYIIRGTIPDQASAQDVYALTLANPEIVGVYSDPRIESVLICPGSPPLGTKARVAELLHAATLRARSLEGKGVYVAIVDTGVNAAYLAARGVTASIDPARSWKPAGVLTNAGAHPVGHGTMCAFDALIMAPKATILDHAVLLSTASGPTAMAGLLSDAIQSYAKLRTVLLAMPPKKRAMVVSNSWGMFDPEWDFPVGHPGNYSDNPGHPFNLIVRTLASEGADVLFAAGNCGRDCPDGRCEFGSTRPICGANSHPDVLSVAGVDTKKNRVGYSSQGPGRLDKRKPDIAAYTHFSGSGVYAADGGTSAACPVAAGVVAAMRTKWKTNRISSARMRNLVVKTAENRGPVGFDYDYGWGIIDPHKLLGALSAVPSAVQNDVLRPQPRRAPVAKAPKKTARRAISKV